MNLTKDCELSDFQDLTTVNEEKRIVLVRHKDTGKLYVKKIRDMDNLPVYERLKAGNFRGIPKIFCLAEKDGNLIVIEEYIHGDSLDRILKERGYMGEMQAARMMIALCHILNDLHDQQPPIIHRDIKPSNLMLSADHILKLVDFGAAREYREGGGQDTVFMGTEDFAAPEQYGFGQSDNRTDIYGLGATLNYLVCGRTPRHGLCGGPLGRIVEQCTQLDPKQRYQDVEELCRELCVLTGEAPGQADVKKKMGKRKVEAEKNVTDAEKEPGASPKGLYAPIPWIPPGFRSGHIWKMVVAVSGYSMIAACTLLNKFSTDGVLLTGVPLFIDRIFSFLALMLWVLLGCNYMGIERFFPLLTRFREKPVVKILLKCVYCIVILFVAAFAVGFLEAMLK